MIVELISVGTELLMGNIVNTNAPYLSKQCACLGMKIYYQVTVGDNAKRLKETIQTALSRCDLVILTGGLGPTEDDLTKETTAQVLEKRLVCDPHTKERLCAYFQKRGETVITENNWKQAEIIEGCTVFDNENGTAPGLYLEEKGKKVLLLPGPPNELIPMMETKVYPFLASLTKQHLYSNMIKICGIGESKAETMIKDLIDTQSNPTIATYAKTGEVDIRITAMAKTKEEGERLLQPVKKELCQRFQENIFTDQEDIQLEDCVVRLLKEKGYTVTTAESCTGGLLAGRLLNVSGASAVFKEGHITYAEEAKKKYLGVLEETLATTSAVSEKTAEEMARGAAKLAKADVAVSVTGLAGPDGDGKNLVGTVFIGCCIHDKVTVKKYVFHGNRAKVRESAVQNALDLLRRCICS